MTQMYEEIIIKTRRCCAIKKILTFALIVSFVFILIGCNRQEKAKEDIIDLVEENYDAILKACEDKDENALLSIKGITPVNIVDGYVIVFCKGAGIAPSSQDYGFYYSEGNIPVGVGYGPHIVCKIEDMTPDGNGYKGIVDGNSFYTEHIKGNVYFYSNAY